MPLCVRRGIQITGHHFAFGTNAPLGCKDLSDEIQRSRVYSADAKRCIAKIMAVMTELCVFLTDVLTLVYQTDPTPVHGGAEFMGHDPAAKIQQCRETLRRWRDRANSVMRPAIADAHYTPDTTCHSHMITLYSSLIWMYYQ